MADTNILEEQLVVGRSLLLSTTTPSGHIQLSAEITSLGGHHFKVRADTSIPQTLFAPQQQLKIRLMGDGQSTLPLSCRFLRVDPKKPKEIVLSFPEGEWITNRRAFVRAAIQMPVSIIRNSGQQISGETIDVSGGGVLTKLNADLNQGEMITLHLGPIPDSEDILQFDAKVARLVQLNVNRRNDSPSFTAYALKFVKAPTRAQNRICKLVIVNQFEQRRAELREFLGKEK